MTEERASDPGNALDRFVADYEAAQAGGGPVDLQAFLPGPGHPLYRDVLRELVRVELEYGWARGQARRLEEYQHLFPQLFQAPDDLQAIAFEEYRLRRQAGECPGPEEYRQRFGVDVRDWPVPQHLSNGRRAPANLLGGHELPASLPDVPRPSPAEGRRSHAILTDLPEVGTEFLGFHLMAELGRGAFGRAYLARQGELADRPVALKVSRDVLGESHTLAQLQHTNIIPIFSVHHAGPFHAVCMPFLGATTLAHVLRGLQGQTPLPASGRALVDTLNACKSITRRGDGSRPPQPPSGGTRPGPAGEAAGAAAALPGGESAPCVKALEGLTYVQAVLWVVARLADGLAHAHERGILHRDLKPANVLLSDEGQPILLDFNLSEDTKLRPGAPAAFLGGTLPYMAPEQLAAFRHQAPCPDARSDLYSLGVILYELLTGRHPFPVRHGALDEVLPGMLQDRLRPPGGLRGPAVSPAVESIVRHCLEAEPGRRYQSARDLREDLQRQLDDLPLRHAPEPSLRERLTKWKRRHPRLTSAGSLAAAAAVLVAALAGGLVWRGRQLADLQAQAARQQLQEEARAAGHDLANDLKSLPFLLSTPHAEPGQVRDGWAQARRHLERYGPLERDDWQQGPLVQHLPAEERQVLLEDMAELLFLLAAASEAGLNGGLEEALRLNGLSQACYAPGDVPGALLMQRARLERRAGRVEEAGRLEAQARRRPARGWRDQYLLAREQIDRGQFRQPLAFLREASRQAPDDYSHWLVLGNCYAGLGDPGRAVAYYDVALTLSPSSPWVFFNRGRLHLDQHKYKEARADFDRALELRPGMPEALVNRALARLGQKDYTEAVDDLTQALQQGQSGPRVYFLRARALALAGKPDEARRDREEGLRREPQDEADWVARGMAHLPGDPQAALADLNRAFQRYPRSRRALENKAHVLAEYLQRNEDAVAVLNEALTGHPDYVRARAGRAVLLARLGRREAALRDARQALAGPPKGEILYQIAGAYALTSRDQPADRAEAYRLLTEALRLGFGARLLERDPDLAPLRHEPQFRRLVEAARALLPAGPPAGGH
jgi:serine/threonine protein kinase/Tfp pilus assembly protein PilF